MVNDTFGSRITRRRALGHAGAIAAPLLLAGATPAWTVAREGTPVATPTAPEFDPAVVGTVQFTHLEKIYFYLPGFQDEAGLAAILGIDVVTYRRIKDDFAAAARGAAEELLADGDFAAKVDELPFRAGSVVVAVGESDTDDLQSRFEILRHLLELGRPGDGLHLVNAGISGQNTSEALGWLGTVLGEEPDWILCLLGGNDALRNGAGATKTEVSSDETARNLTKMRHLATAASETSRVWLTSPPIDEARTRTFPGFQFGGITFSNADIDPINAFIRRQSEPVVDINAAFGNPVGSALLGLDGLHASLDGHAAIARAVVERLAE